MKDILANRREEILVKIEEQNFGEKDELAIEQKVAEYKQKLVEEVKAQKQAQKEKLESKLEEIDYLIGKYDEEKEQVQEEQGSNTSTVDQMLTF